MKVVAVSGGFDPVHVGHLRMFKEAKKIADVDGDGYLVVILNNDNWLMTKKSFIFMPEEERKEILEAFKYVDEVILSYHEPNPKDSSVCAELEVLNPHTFANGGDRKAGNTPEYDLCRELGIEMKFNVGGVKHTSSSDIIKRGKGI